MRLTATASLAAAAAAAAVASSADDDGDDDDDWRWSLMHVICLLRHLSSSSSLVIVSRCSFSKIGETIIFVTQLLFLGKHFF